jgi:xylan 1,4-beta-xylosidase
VVPETGSPETVTLRFKGHSATHVLIFRVDGEHGDARSTYEKMGSPRYPTEAQIEALRSAARLPAPESRDLHNGELTLTLPAHGLAVIEVK